MRETLILGTTVPMNLNLSKIGTMGMSQYDYTLYAYCSSTKVVTIPKSAMTRVDDDNYMFWVDTKLVGCGNLRYTIEAHIPDTNLDALVRPEIIDIDSGYTIIESPALKNKR